MKKEIAFICVLFCLMPSALGYSQATGDTSPLKNGQEIGPALDIILVLDNSGSMKKNDPEFLTREVVADFLYGAGSRSRLGMIIFDKAVHLLEPLQTLTGLAAKARFQKSLERVTYRGQLSDSPAAVERALYELKTNGREAAEKVIILLTDGIVDLGNSRKNMDQERWLKQDLALECQKEKVRIFGIAFTDQADFSLIQALAFKTDGEYFRAFKAAEIHGIFDRINTILSKPRTKPALPVAPAAAPPAPASTTAAPPQVSKSTAAAPPQPPAPSAAAPEVEARKPSPPPRKESRLLIYILGALSVLLVVVLILVSLNKISGALVRIVLPGLASRRAPPMPRAELVDVKNVTSKKTFRFENTSIWIGRDANNDVAIPRDTVSSSHASIEFREGGFYLEDQRSKNKTYLNGEEIEPHSPKKLKNGDVIAFNTYKFIFLLPDLMPAGKTVMDYGRGAEAAAQAGGPAIRETAPTGDSAAVPQAMLVDIKNVTSKKTMSLEKKITKIGRSVYNEVVISEISISGSHAFIEYRDGFYYLEDQRSKNKTFLNGEVLEPNQPRKLKSGDEIAFASYKFIFLLERQTPTGETEEGL